MKNRYQYTNGDQTKSSWKDEAVTHISNFLGPDKKNAANKSLEAGISAIAKTAMRRLPVPFNYVAPLIVEKVVLKYGIDSGREVLLKGLKWVKKVTDEKPAKMVL